MVKKGTKTIEELERELKAAKATAKPAKSEPKLPKEPRVQMSTGQRVAHAGKGQGVIRTVQYWYLVAWESGGSSLVGHGALQPVGEGQGKSKKAA